MINFNPNDIKAETLMYALDSSVEKNEMVAVSSGSNILGHVAAMNIKQYCLVYGSISEGIVGVVGPFANEEEVDDYIANNELSEFYELNTYIMDSPSNGSPL